MTKKSNPADAGKEARLAAALRENLKRRKAQARARAEKPENATESLDPVEPSPGEEG